MPYLKYTDSEIKDILKNIVVLCDSREQQNKHITEYFDSKSISHQTQKLDSADYSVMLPALHEYGIKRPIYFDNSIAIERKGSLEELSGNLTKERSRLEEEFTRLSNIKAFLMIENPGGYGAIWNHKYQTQYNEKSFMASLLAFQQRYNLNVTFIDRQYSGIYIHSILFYHVREFLHGRSVS